jgi:hypothetical protein
LKQWSKHEQEMKEQLLEKLIAGPKKTFLHRTFNFLSFLMGVAGFLMLVGQLVGLYFYNMDPIQSLMRCYVVLMCALIVLNEMGWTSVVRESDILRIWIFRGIFYSFVGVLGMEEMDTESASAHTTAASQKVALKFIQIVAYVMVGCGIAYFIMGCLCLQLLRNRIVTDYEQRCKEAKANRQKIIETVV